MGPRMQRTPYVRAEWDPEFIPLLSLPSTHTHIQIRKLRSKRVACFAVAFS